MTTLDQLGLKHGTDKASSGHDYCKIYERYIGPVLQSSPFTLIEFGVGGDEHPNRGGQSLRMWNEWLPHATIVGVDLYHKNLGPIGPRVTIRLGDQTDVKLMQEIVDLYGRPQVVIDDASHHNRLTIETFECMWPHLLSGGLFFCEDVHTSYWKAHYDGSPNPLARGTTMAFFQELTAQLNHDTLLPLFRNSYAGQIEFIHFYKELVIIKKL